jgi:hypothetical protein
VCFFTKGVKKSLFDSVGVDYARIGEIFGFEYVKLRLFRGITPSWLNAS